MQKLPFDACNLAPNCEFLGRALYTGSSVRVIAPIMAFGEPLESQWLRQRGNTKHSDCQIAFGCSEHSNDQETKALNGMLQRM
jgi:hypothetical protein